MMVEINTPEYWDKKYSKGFYQDDFYFNYKYFCEFIDVFLRNKGKLKVIDVGCGLAIISNHVAKLGHKVLATDFSKTAIKECKLRFKNKNLKFELGDIRQLKNKYFQKFNVVIATELIEHFKNPYYILRNLFKLIKDDGFLIFTTPYMNNNVPLEEWEEHETMWNYQNTVERMKTVGFKGVSFYCGNAAYGINVMGVAYK